MVSVTPVGTMRLAVTEYGPPAAVHVVLVASVPEAVATVVSSYQTSNDERSVSAPAASKAWINTWLMPGFKATPFALHVAVHAVQVAATPLTFTERVLIAFALPPSVVVAVVVIG